MDRGQVKKEKKTTSTEVRGLKSSLNTGIGFIHFRAACSVSTDWRDGLKINFSYKIVNRKQKSLNFEKFNDRKVALHSVHII